MDNISKSTIFQKETTNLSGNFIVAVILFFLNPPISIIFLSFTCVRESGKNEKTFFILYFFLSLYLGLIMSTKVPESDWLSYKTFFDQAISSNLLEYMENFRAEPIFYLITFMLSKLCLGNFSLYAIVIISFGYYLMFVSIHLFFRFFSQDYFILIFAIFIFAFFNNQFSYSGHLTRQVLAGCLFIYFAINRILYKKNKWIALIAAIFIHTTIIPLCLFLFIPQMKKKIHLKHLIYIGVSFMTLFGIYLLIRFFFGSAIMQISWLNYGFERIDNIENLRYSWYYGEGKLIRIYYLILLVIAARAYFSSNQKAEVHYLLNIYLFFIIILEYLCFSQQFFLLLRFSVYIFLFIPFIIPFLFFKNVKNNYGHFSFKSIQLVLIIASIGRFFYGITHNYFQYGSLTELLCYPPVLYFFR
jgi:EpsG family